MQSASRGIGPASRCKVKRSLFFYAGEIDFHSYSSRFAMNASSLQAPGDSSVFTVGVIGSCASLRTFCRFRPFNSLETGVC
jgi:hypothetical protein